jgi:hypothetical protein
MAPSAQHRPAELQGARRSGNQGRAEIRLPLVALNGGGAMLRCITTFVAVAIGALVMVAGAVAGKPDIANFAPVELVGLPQHDCGDYELLLSGTLERLSRFTLDEAGQDVAERRQVRIAGTIYNAGDPTKAAPYLRSIQIDWNFVTGERAIIGTTRVVLPGDGIVFRTAASASRIGRTSTSRRSSRRFCSRAVRRTRSTLRPGTVSARRCGRAAGGRRVRRRHARPDVNESPAQAGFSLRGDNMLSGCRHVRRRSRLCGPCFPMSSVAA